MQSPALESKKIMNCVLYLRVSSDLQVDNFSLDTQEKICRDAASRLGYSVIETFREEGQSARTTDRTQLIKLLDYCRKNKNNITSVMAYRIDRVARQTSDYLSIKKILYSLGIKLESASEPTGTSPTDTFVETLLAANAQLDNEIRGERARNGLYARFKTGLINKPPIGYMFNSENKKAPVLPDPKLFDLIKQSWELMGTGTKSLSEMAKIMNDWGIKLFYSGKFHPVTKQSAGKTFRNKFYAGYLVSKKYNEEIKGQHTPMISEELFYRVQRVVDGNRTAAITTKHKKYNPNFPLRGIIRCYECGNNLVSGNCKGHGGNYLKYWCAKGHKPTVNASKLDYELKTILGSIQPTQEVIDLFTLSIHINYNSQIEKLKEIQKKAEKKILEAKQMMTALVEGHLKGLYPDDIFKEQKAKFEDQILSAQIIKNDSICDKYDLEAITAFIKALLYDLPKAYEVSDFGQKQVLIGSIFPNGLVYNNGMILNPEISPIFRSIQEFSNPSVLLGAGKRT